MKTNDENSAELQWPRAESYDRPAGLIMHRDTGSIRGREQCNGSQWMKSERGPAQEPKGIGRGCDRDKIKQAQVMSPSE